MLDTIVTVNAYFDNCSYHNFKHRDSVCQLGLHDFSIIDTSDSVCDNNCSVIHCILVGIASVITVILFIAVIMCIIITYVLTKGVRFMIHHFSASETDRANGEHGMMVHHTQQQEEQNGNYYHAITYSFSVLVYTQYPIIRSYIVEGLVRRPSHSFIHAYLHW